jgi:cyclopropane-fatty-acyl-phospholipid synthase
MPATMAEIAVDALIARFGARFKPFSIEMPDGQVRIVGDGEPVFRAALRNERAVKAVRSLDEGNLAEAYMRGDIDLDGDMLQPFALRASLDDRHLLTSAWRFLQPLLFGQVYTNRQAIKSHYDADQRLFLSFLDETHPAYSQGVYESDDEQLATALERKFTYVVERCELGPGKRVLEIGPGWGAFAGYALQSDTDFTGITISKASQAYLTEKLSSIADRFRIHLTDFLRYEPTERFDAIVIMGVIEHLPDYARVLRKFDRLLKPGGFVFLDGSAAKKKYELSTFMARHIYPGNHSFLGFDDFLNKLGRVPLDLVEAFSDRWSYFLTFRQWAQNLERSSEFVRREFGDFEYRKFRLYLFGAAYEFMARNLDCYRLVLYKPKTAS